MVFVWFDSWVGAQRRCRRGGNPERGCVSAATIFTILVDSIHCVGNNGKRVDSLSRLFNFLCLEPGWRGQIYCGSCTAGLMNAVWRRDSYRDGQQRWQRISSPEQIYHRSGQRLRPHRRGHWEQAVPHRRLAQPYGLRLQPLGLRQASVFLKVSACLTSN